MELDFLTFTYNGVERKCRRIKLGDYSALRERIRRERVDALGQHPDPATIAATVAQPVTGAELFERMLDVQGNALILHRCAHEVDETFSFAEAEAMVLDGDPFVQRLYEESKLINPPEPTPSPGSSSGADGDRATSPRSNSVTP